MKKKQKINLLCKALMDVQDKLEFIALCEPKVLRSKKGVKKTYKLCETGWRTIEDVIYKTMDD